MTAAATAKTQVLDFSNVRDGGGWNSPHKTPGDYRAKITKVEDSKSQAGNEMWVFTVTLTTDTRTAYPYRCTLDEKSLWKVRNLFIAAGMAVPKKRVKVDPNKLVNKEIGVALEDDEYEGKVRSQIQATFPVSELDGDDPGDAGDNPDDEVADDDADVTDDDLDELDDID